MIDFSGGVSQNGWKKTKNDGTKVETVVETKTDGSKKETVTETKADGSVIKTVVKKDASGVVTSSKAKVTVTSTETTQDALVQFEVTKEWMQEISNIDSAETETVTIKVLNENRATAYKVTVEPQDIQSGETLYLVRQKKATGEQILTDAKECVISEEGTFVLSISKKGNYVLLNEAEMKALEETILDSVTLEGFAQGEKAKEKMAVGETMKITLSKECKKANIESIVYESKKPSVATVNKKGVIKTKQEGKAKIKITVTLKNGTVKTLKGKVVVKV